MTRCECEIHATRSWKFKAFPDCCVLFIFYLFPSWSNAQPLKVPVCLGRSLHINCWHCFLTLYLLIFGYDTACTLCPQVSHRHCSIIAHLSLHITICTAQGSWPSGSRCKLDLEIPLESSRVRCGQSKASKYIVIG